MFRQLFIKTFHLFLVALITTISISFIANFIKPYVGCLLLVPSSYFILFLSIFIIYTIQKKSLIKKNFQNFILYSLGFLIVTLFWDISEFNQFTESEILWDLLILFSLGFIMSIYYFKNFKINRQDLYLVLISCGIYLLIFQIRHILYINHFYYF